MSVAVLVKGHDSEPSEGRSVSCCLEEDYISPQRNSISRALHFRCSAYFREGAPYIAAVTCACHRYFRVHSPLGRFIHLIMV